MDFEDIRPYYDHEVQEKFSKLLSEPQFQAALQHVNPEVPIESYQQEAAQITSIKELQAKIILPALQRFLANTVTHFDHKGMDNLEKDNNYLFVSTHRDIVFDSAILNYVLQQNDFNTAEIAIGDNLMNIPWVVDLVKLNKSFIVKRNLPRDQIIEGSKQLSAYIQHTLKEKKESIWIAQRSGRSKDGNDETNQSLLKMFSLSAQEETFFEQIKSLNICPVSIAYEYNPCDILTLPELIKNSRGEKYVKAPGEDMEHMLKGILGHKGKVTVSFGKPINNSLDELNGIKNKNEFFNALAERIDREIHGTYQLLPSNYIAFDLMQEESLYSHCYSDEEKAQFESYVEEKIAQLEGEEEELKRSIFLKSYAHPVINWMKL